MLKVAILLFAGLSAINCDIPPEELTTENNLFVFASIDHDSPLPEHAEEVSAHNLPTDVQNDDISKKRIVAIPLSKMAADTNILVNEAGHALVAKLEEYKWKPEDFLRISHRKKQAERRGAYVLVGYQQYPGHYNVNRRYYPVGHEQYSGPHYPNRSIYPVHQKAQ